MLLALIFSAVIVPATAHAQDLREVHANDMLTNVDHSDHEAPIMMAICLAMRWCIIIAASHLPMRGMR